MRRAAVRDCREDGGGTLERSGSGGVLFMLAVCVEEGGALLERRRRFRLRGGFVGVKEHGIRARCVPVCACRGRAVDGSGGSYPRRRVSREVRGEGRGGRLDGGPLAFGIDITSNGGSCGVCGGDRRAIPAEDRPRWTDDAPGLVQVGPVGALWPARGGLAVGGGRHVWAFAGMARSVVLGLVVVLVVILLVVVLLGC